MTSCNDCGHSKNKDCQWDYLYGDTDYAYDCCDFYRVKTNNVSPPDYKDDRLSRPSTTELG